MAITPTNAYGTAGYTGKIAAPDLQKPRRFQEDDNVNLYGADMYKPLRDMYKDQKKAIEKMQKENRDYAKEVFNNVSKAKAPNNYFNIQKDNMFRGLVNESIEIKNGMEKEPGAEGYVDPVIGTQYLQKIDDIVDNYEEMINSAAAEAVLVKEALNNPMGEENALSVTGLHIPQAELLVDWIDGNEKNPVNMRTVDGQVSLYRGNVNFNLTEWMLAKDLDQDMMARIPEYKEKLKLASSGELGGLDGESFNTNYYDYNLERDVNGNQQLNFKSLSVKEDALLLLQKRLAGQGGANMPGDPIIEDMANDPLKAKIYWADVFGKKTEYDQSKNLDELKMLLAGRSIELSRAANGSINVKSFDTEGSKITTIPKRNTGGSGGSNSNITKPKIRSSFVTDVEVDVETPLNQIIDLAQVSEYVADLTDEDGIKEIERIDQEINKLIDGSEVLTEARKDGNFKVVPGKAGEVIVQLEVPKMETIIENDEFGEPVEKQIATTEAKTYNIKTVGGYKNMIKELLKIKYPNMTKPEKEALESHLDGRGNEMKLQNDKDAIVETNQKKIAKFRKAYPTNTNYSVSNIIQQKTMNDIPITYKPKIGTPPYEGKRKDLLTVGTSPNFVANYGAEKVTNNVANKAMGYPINIFLNKDYGNADMSSVADAPGAIKDLVSIFKTAIKYYKKANPDYNGGPIFADTGGDGEVDVRTILPWKDAEKLGVSKEDYDLANGVEAINQGVATNRLNLINALNFVNLNYLNKINEGALAPILLNK